MKNKLYFFCVLMVFLSFVGADQATKLIALTGLPFDREVLGGGVFSLHLILNDNTFLARFEDPLGFGNNGSYRGLYLMMASFLTLTIVGTSIFLNKKTVVFPIRLITMGLIIILAGVWGNAIDYTIRHGAIDFIRYNNTATIPIFNLADIFVWIGEIFIFSGLAIFWSDKKYRGLLDK